MGDWVLLPPTNSPDEKYSETHISNSIPYSKIFIFDCSITFQQTTDPFAQIFPSTLFHFIFHKGNSNSYSNSQKMRKSKIYHHSPIWFQIFNSQRVKIFFIFIGDLPNRLHLKKMTFLSEVNLSWILHLKFYPSNNIP